VLTLAALLLCSFCAAVDVLEFIMESNREHYLNLLRYAAAESNIEHVTAMREQIKLRAIAYEFSVVSYVERLVLCAPHWKTMHPDLKAAFVVGRPMLCNPHLEVLIAAFRKVDIDLLHDPFFDSIPPRCAATVQVSVDSAGVDLTKLTLSHSGKTLARAGGADAAAASSGVGAEALSAAGKQVFGALQGQSDLIRKNQAAVLSGLSRLNERVTDIQTTGDAVASGVERAAALSLLFNTGCVQTAPGVNAVPLATLLPAQLQTFSQVVGLPLAQVQNLAADSRRRQTLLGGMGIGLGGPSSLPPSSSEDADMSAAPAPSTALVGGSLPSAVASFPPLPFLPLSSLPFSGGFGGFPSSGGFGGFPSSAVAGGFSPGAAAGGFPSGVAAGSFLGSFPLGRARSLSLLPPGSSSVAAAPAPRGTSRRARFSPSEEAALLAAVDSQLAAAPAASRPRVHWPAIVDTMNERARAAGRAEHTIRVYKRKFKVLRPESTAADDE
jgi:hypothetical protein